MAVQETCQLFLFSQTIIPEVLRNLSVIPTDVQCSFSAKRRKVNCVNDEEKSSKMDSERPLRVQWSGSM